MALQQAEEAFNKLDLNGDGEVSKAELEHIAKETAPETTDPNAREESIRQFFTTFDANEDGKVQKSEWLSFFEKVFDHAFESTIRAAEY